MKNIQYPMNPTLKIWILCTIYLVLGTIKSQTFPINAQLSVAPPYSLYLMDYATGSNLQLNLIQRDINGIAQEAYLNIELEGAGIRLKTLPSFRPSTYIDVVPGNMLTLSNTELSEYFNSNALSFEGISKESFVANGQALPEGLYKLKIKAILKLTGSQASNEAMALMGLFKGQPPLINVPLENAKVAENPMQNFNISWTNRNSASFNQNNIPSYHLQMWEMLDPTQDPNIIVNSNYPPILDEFTNFLSYQYGPSNTPLTAGKTYVIRVQVLDPDGRDIYANGGFSQVRKFTYGDACNPPTKLTATLDARGIVANWALTPNQGGYRIQYGRIDTAWQETETFINRYAIEKTYPSAQYQMRVATLCAAGKQSEYSDIVLISTPPSGANNQVSCGDSPNIQIKNSKLLPTLKVGDRFTAYDFEVSVTQVFRNDSTSYKGEGKTPFYMFGGTEVLCYFDGITLNTEHQLLAGEVKFQQKPYVFSDRNIKQFKEDFKDTKEMATGNDAASPETVNVEVTIGTVSYDSSTKQIAVRDRGGNVIKTLSPGKDYKITDKDGNVFLVSKDNKVSQQSKTTETAVKNGGPVQGGGENTELYFVEGQPILSFVAHPQQVYGFDAVPMHSMADILYESITNDLQAYYVPNKSIASAGTDKVIAKLESNPKGVDLKRIKFKTHGGQTVPFSYDSLQKQWTLTITGALHRQDFSVFPYYGKGKDTLCGKLNVMPLDRKEIKLVLVPLNGYNTSKLKTADLEAYLNKVYQQANIAYKLSLDRPFSSASADLPLSVEHGKLEGEYSANQAAVIGDYTAQHPEQDNTIYLFLCKEGSSSIIKGHTPVNRSYGFLFGENIDPRTIAHELGHGYPLALEHPFTTGGATGTYTNLMDYASGTNLSFKQWALAHNPKLKVRFGQSSEQGELFEELVNMKKFLEWLKSSFGKPSDYRYGDFVAKGLVDQVLPSELHVTGTSPYVLKNSCCELFTSPIFYDATHFGVAVAINEQGKPNYSLTISQKDIGKEAFTISCQNYSDYTLLLQYLGLQLSGNQKDIIANAYLTYINKVSGNCEGIFNVYANAPPFLSGRIDDSKLFNHLFALSNCPSLTDLQASVSNIIGFFKDKSNAYKLLNSKPDMLMALYGKHNSFSRWLYLKSLILVSNSFWAGQSFSGDKQLRTFYQYPDAFIVSTPKNNKLFLQGKYYNNQQPAYAGDSYASVYAGGDFDLMDRLFLVIPDKFDPNSGIEVSVPAIYCHGLSDENIEERNFSAAKLVVEGGLNSILTLLDAGAIAKIPFKGKMTIGLKSSTDDALKFIDNLGSSWDANLKRALRYDIDGNAVLKTLFTQSDELAKVEYANAWRVLIKYPDLRKSKANLGLLRDVQSRFTFNTKDGFAGLVEILKSHSDVPQFLANLKKVDPLFGKVPNIKYTGTTSSPRVRIVDNDAIPLGYRPNDKGDLKATSLKSFKLVDQSNLELFTEEFLKSFEFDFKGLIIKAENIRLGGVTKNKIAIIGKSMGGGMRKNPDTGVEDFAFGVTDYALKLRSIGFETRLFIQTEQDGLPYLEKKAIDQMDEFVEEKALELGVDKKSKEAWLSYDEILTKNGGKPVLAYQLNIEWAKELVDRGYTVIDIGNPNNIAERSAFYNGERMTIFGK